MASDAALPLAGWHVLVARPLAQAQPWALSLAALGARPHLVPLLGLAPVTGPEQVQAIKNQMLEFDLFHKAIFVSQNAVDFGLRWLDDYWPQLPSGIQYFGVGAATARRLAAQGLTVSALGVTEDGAMNSESLLQAPELQSQQVAGERIVIFRGCGGRGRLAEVLTSRGARVSYCEVYRRFLPPDAEAALRDFALQTQGESRAVAVHSGETLDNLRQLLARPSLAGILSPSEIEELPLLLPGERVAAMARAAGFRRVIPAENATDLAMTQALVRHINDLPAPGPSVE